MVWIRTNPSGGPEPRGSHEFGGLEPVDLALNHRVRLTDAIGEGAKMQALRREQERREDPRLRLGAQNRGES
jgi:hypothetical protein